jgi:SulP family sulfate permease
MGLGVGLFAAFGLGSSAGALAGLIGAAAISLVSGIGGNNRGMISAPNGPVIMLLIASMATLNAQGVSGGDALVTLALLITLAGLIQLVIALSGGGQLIKYIPYPMVAGLVTVVGILMMRSQLAPVLPAADAGMTGPWRWVPVATAVVTFAGIKLMPRVLPRIPGIIGGLVVGLGGGGTKGSTLVAIGAGGRRWSAVVASLGFILLLVAGGPIGRDLPISVLAGVIIYVGFNMLEWRLLLWLRSPRTRIDAILALSVVACTLFFDPNVGVGALGAMLLFLRDQIRADMIHSRSSGREMRSLRLRGTEDHALLDEHGDRIVYIELRGHLFFGTVDRLFTELATLLERPVWIVINMRRVQSIDLTALDLFRQMELRLRSHGGHMLFANIHRGAAQGRKIDKLLRSFSCGYTQAGIKTSFKSTDKALEAAEDRLLSALGRPPTPIDARVELEDNDLFRDIDAGLLKALRPLMQEHQLPRKARPFKVGDPGDTLYFVIQGVVDLRLPSGTFHYKRLSSIGPGGYFGATGFVDPARVRPMQWSPATPRC